MNYKKLIIIAVCAIWVVVLGVLAFLPGVEVSDKQIEDRMLYNKISNATYKICFENNPEEYKKVELPTDRGEVKEQMAFYITVCNLLKEKNILMDKSETDSIATAEYESMLTDEQQATFREALFKVLQKENISKEKYLELACEIAYYKYNSFNLEKDFEHTEYDQKAEEDFDTQFKEYVEDNMPFSLF